ncbi:uncharacterized protein SCHCODRAFT_02705595 [Schizophyllum commune H4-8]|uniref:Uncharacterized protein n=1 Tax=Schizophyllum commune (strain H4-8 / FGSC 9210) TaxID=578458 RepID=D8QH74_SCHCM|nr:uncharacterized protein SCHCODRAFT_02705595 [Schizophyllum commune H4-8]KAI5887059.1 hypothetical protein SCHCODRAFT_02705595 [Schizophyllum commune H4-8]
MSAATCTFTYSACTPAAPHLTLSLTASATQQGGHQFHPIHNAQVLIQKPIAPPLPATDTDMDELSDHLASTTLDAHPTKASVHVARRRQRAACRIEVQPFPWRAVHGASKLPRLQRVATKPKGAPVKLRGSRPLRRHETFIVAEPVMVYEYV